MLFREILNVTTEKSFIDITDRVKKIVEQCKIKEGICNLFLTSTKTGLMINENEIMLIEDFKLFFEELVEENKPRFHSNAVSHLRSQIVGVSKNIPISNNKLILGKLQRIILCEFGKEKKREIIITIIGG